MLVELDNEAAEKLTQMAREENVSIIELLDCLIIREDRWRHVEIVPYGGEVRVRCFCVGCKETRFRSTVVNLADYEV